MLQAAVLLAVCLLIGLISLAISAWVTISGQLFTMDGLLLVATSLAGGALFLGNLAWSIHTGEVREILNRLRSGRREPRAQDESSGEGKA